MPYKIETGVPIPEWIRCGPAKNPNSFASALRSLEVGQSVFAAGMKVNTAGATGRVLTQREKLDARFVCRTVTENGVKGVRVWRIA